MDKLEKNTFFGRRIFVAVLALFAAASIFVILSMKAYVQESIHNERATYLKAQTETTAGMINQQMTRYLDYSRICRNVISIELKDGGGISDFMDTMYQELSMADGRLILIDEKSTWYGENGTTGKISATEYYGSRTEDELIYMTIGVDADVESMCFRQRLDHPVKVVTQSGEAEIMYCCVIYYMDRLNQELATAFPYDCNSFIVDDEGMMIYQQLDLNRLVDGTNVFSKYQRVNFLYGDDGDRIIEQIKNDKSTAGEFILDKDHYFICTAPLNVNEWTVVFVLSAGQLAAGSYIGALTMYMSILGILFTLMILYTLIAIINNRTDRKRLEAEQKANAMLDRASRAKGEFLSNMSHDIRTPINGIMGMTAMAAREDNPEKTRECLEKIEVSSKYLLSLVNDVLDMSAIENGKLVISEAPLDIKKFMDDCITIVSATARGKNIDLIKDYDDIVHTNVLADEVHLRQIFINILGNAVKFTPEGGHITLRACENETAAINNKLNADSDNGSVKLHFEIEDNGEGMSEEFAKQIWNRFSQESNKSRTQFKGTGLGMAITKSLVDAMGGTISVESVKGEGSTFKFDIEFRLHEGITADPEKDDTQTDSDRLPLDGVRILLAEDNEINMEIVRDMLESEGATVTATYNGQEVTDAYKQSDDGAYDIVLLDIMMPVMDGLEAARVIRSSDRKDAKTIPIVAMTANAFDSDMEAAEDAGMDDYITKPFNKDKMLNVILKKIVRTGLLIMALCAMVVFPLGGCAGKTAQSKDDKKDEQISMYVGLGNTTTDYYPALHEKILEGTGIDVKFIYNNTMDTSNSMVNRLENYDLPADIIVTSSRSPVEAQKNSLLDMAAYTNIPDLFSATRMKDVSVDGAIYQIPFCTRLIGVEYNKTLLKEHGWKLPENFEEMVELKKKADEAGVTFAISGGAATGHGFNYLFHLMGSQYLSSADGTEWLEEFLAGETGVDEFAVEAEYFKKYAEAGLYGRIHDEDWNPNAEFGESRAIFYYNILNDAVSENGDEYASMPWLSENGMSNCFTAYDNVFVGLDKALAEPENAARLEQATKVLEYMAGDEAGRLFLDTTPDGYLSTTSFEIDESRLYYDSANGIKKGYLMPWYYNDFDVDSIVNVGQVVNDYMKGTEGVSFEDIMDELALQNEKHVNGKVDVVCHADETFDYEDVAKLEAAAGGMATQEAVDAAGINAQVQIAIVPYTDSIENLPLYRHVGVAQERIYEGDIEAAKLRSYITNVYNDMQLFTMTGAEVKELVQSGYNTSADLDYDHVYQYSCIIRSGSKESSVDELDDASSYYVAISPGSMEQSRYKALISAGAMITDRDNKTVAATIEHGLSLYFADRDNISPYSISWE